jgi:GxxExxY protein
LRGIKAINQLAVPVEYKGLVFETPLRLDLYVESCLIVEIKAIEQIQPIHKAQVLSYMKLLNAPLGLILNFHEVRMANGISRLILQGADQP